jgi:aspartyl-tRNA(Asn)/glutamyl-tRNA(Gln) amidotransferase subunit B
MKWETVIGLEVHAQLQTVSKIFSGAATAYGALPNVQASAVDLGYPGVLPVLNGAAVEMAVKFGLAVGSEINRRSIFARKNYFYPDLPKGYQISQFDQPIVIGGYLDITLDENTIKRINLVRAHLEEDAGKSIHGELEGLTGIDLNRAGTPLLEIVTEPDMRSAKEAVTYLKTLHTLVRYLNICDGNMQEGSFRCDVNISVRPEGQKEFGTRAEIKNVNSFRFVEHAILYETTRQIELITDGGKVVQETRLYDPDKGETRSLRSKEDAQDYRYFPDPDLLPVVLDEAFIQNIKDQLPELPQQKRERFVKEHGLSPYDAEVLTSSRDLAAYYETAVTHSKTQEKLVANWVSGEVLAGLNKNNLDITECPIPAEQIGKLTSRIADNTISGKIAKTIFAALWEGAQDVDEIIESQGLRQVTDTSAISKIIDDIIAANPAQVAEYRSGKDKLFGFFVGQTMKASQGKANPDQVNELLKEKLQK